MKICLSARALMILCLVVLATVVHATEYKIPTDSPGFAQPRFTSSPIEVAFPGVEYNIRPAIKGGTYPYSFSLAKAPEGMTINKLSGTIAWIPADQESATDVEIVVTDGKGKTAKQAFTLRITRSAFFHVSPDGDDKADGSRQRPWKTIERAIMPPEDFTYPKDAVLYIHGGEYKVNVPASEGKKSANVLMVNEKSPKRWIAWPGDKPVIDLGWSVEKQEAAHAEQRASGKLAGEGKEPSTQSYGHRIQLVGGSDYLYIDGLEVKNACYYMFQMWEGRNTFHLRRSNLHHLYCDWAENPAFIFTFAGQRRGKFDEWGVRPQTDYYMNFVIQDNWIHHRFFHGNGGHGGAMVFYTVKDAIVEDNVIEDMGGGEALGDKDNGFGNTYRNNVLRGTVSVMGQWCNDELEIVNNYIEGNFRVGLQPGWIRNIWIHQNTIRGRVILMGGATTVPEPLPAQGDFSGPTTADSLRIIREYPENKKLVHFYRNVLIAPGTPTESAAKDENSVLSVYKGKFFAERFRFVRWNENMMSPQSQLVVRWSQVTDWTPMINAGFDADGVRAPVQVDAQGLLEKNSPQAGKLGRLTDHSNK